MSFSTTAAASAVPKHRGRIILQGIDESQIEVASSTLQRRKGVLCVLPDSWSALQSLARKTFGWDEEEESNPTTLKFFLQEGLVHGGRVAAQSSWGGEVRAEAFELLRDDDVIEVVRCAPKVQPTESRKRKTPAVEGANGHATKAQRTSEAEKSKAPLQHDRPAPMLNNLNGIAALNGVPPQPRPLPVESPQMPPLENAAGEVQPTAPARAPTHANSSVMPVLVSMTTQAPPAASTVPSQSTSQILQRSSIQHDQQVQEHLQNRQRAAQQAELVAQKKRDASQIQGMWGLYEQVEAKRVPDSALHYAYTQLSPTAQQQWVQEYNFRQQQQQQFQQQILQQSQLEIQRMAAMHAQSVLSGPQTVTSMFQPVVATATTAQPTPRSTTPVTPAIPLSNVSTPNAVMNANNPSRTTPPATTSRLGSVARPAPALPASTVASASAASPASVTTPRAGSRSAQPVAGDSSAPTQTTIVAPVTPSVAPVALTTPTPVLPSAAPVSAAPSTPITAPVVPVVPSNVATINFFRFVSVEGGTPSASAVVHVKMKRSKALKKAFANVCEYFKVVEGLEFYRASTYKSHTQEELRADPTLYDKIIKPDETPDSISWTDEQYIVARTVG